MAASGSFRRLNHIQTPAVTGPWSLVWFQFRGYKEFSHLCANIVAKFNEEMESFEHMLASPVYF